MAADGSESLRAEARRRGVTLYRVRLERGLAAGKSKRQSVGHGETSMSVFTGGRSRNQRFFQAKYLSPKEKTTAGKYDSLVAQLMRGRIGPAEFRDEVAKLPTFRGRKLASNPDAVLARVEQRRALEEEVFIYERAA